MENDLDNEQGRVPGGDAAKAELDLTCTHTTLRRAARQLGRLYDEALAATDLKSTQIGLLWQIDRLRGEDGPTLQALADEIDVGLSALTYALRPLVRDGLVELQADAHDKRIKHAVLTAVGQSRLEDGGPLWYAVNQRVETVLGTQSAQMLRGLAELVSSKDFIKAFDRGVELPSTARKP